MKKNKLFMSIVLMLLTIFALTSCGNSVTIKSNEQGTKDTLSETSTKSSDDDDDDDYKVTTTDDEDDEEDETTKKTSNSSSKTHSDWDLDTEDDFSFEISSDWTKTKNSYSIVSYSHLGTATDGFTENISILKQDISSYDLDLEGYKELSLQQYDYLGYTVEDIY